MIYLPPLRRLLLPVIVLLALIVFYRSSIRVPTSLSSSFVFHRPPPPPKGFHIPLAEFRTHSILVANASSNHLPPPSQYFYSYGKEKDHDSANISHKSPLYSKPILASELDVLWKCFTRPNKYTKHIRLSNIIQNISQIPPIQSPKPETRVFWNPTVIALPFWSQNQYLVVSRIVTDGNHQANVLCEANVCYTGPAEEARKGEVPCTKDDLQHVGPAGGMRCVTPPMLLRVPPTPAENCEGKYGTYVDIPGFHDPRIFWSGKGEPLMMVNTQSRYACFGLWVIDLRSLHSPLGSLLSASPHRLSLGPLKSYPTLTELTRNPPSTRSAIEKNWLMFFPASGESYIHYDISDPLAPARGRAFAKLLGAGLTTVNLTDPLELPCLEDARANESNPAKKRGTWHQATNSLRLILCNRSEKACVPRPENTVFFAAIHRKHPNHLKLPLRYERYFMVWAATPPFSMLGMSQHPILLANETASGWSASQNWDDDIDNSRIVSKTKNHERNSTEPYGGKGLWAYFTYTVSIAWAWGRHGEVEVEEMNVGYLDDEVVLGIGIDDKAQGFSRVKARDLVQCLRPCPGRKRG